MMLVEAVVVDGKVTGIRYACDSTNYKMRTLSITDLRKLIRVVMEQDLL